MGGTKKKAVVPLKKEGKYKIPLRFDCPLCDAKGSIAVHLIRNIGAARVHCRSCRTGVGKEYPFLPLEKPVDVFFRFREELLQQDRQYLESNCIETDNLPSRTGLTQLAPKAPARDVTAALQRIDLGDEDDEGGDDGTHFFEPAAPAWDDRENEGMDTF